MIKKILYITLLLSLFLTIFSSPVLATTNTEDAFFLCEKTDSNSGNPILPSSPQYDNLDYNHPFVSLLQPLVRLILISMAVVGIGGAIYSTIRDAMFTPDGDDDATKYVKMRIKLIISGLVLPIGILIIGYIIEYVTTYEYMCLLPI